MRIHISFVSVIIPCFNEERYINKCLKSLINNDYPKDKLEILVIDGMSEDRTRKIIMKLMKKFPFIKFMDNKARFQVIALNMGIKRAKGDIIIRCDAHSKYPTNYISELVRFHLNEIVDNVGGVWDTKPGENTIKAKAIAKAMSNILGVGLSYRSIRGNKSLFVDTVPFGSWKKDIFKKYGNFDESFLRAQDLEHNIRIKKLGGKILLLPWLKIKYYARENYTKIWKMFYQYGYFKNLVNKKHKVLSSYRQLIPALFVFIYLLLLAFSFFSFIVFNLFIFFNFIYLSMIFSMSVVISFKERLFSLLPYLILSFIVIHFSYGIGYIKGFIDIFLLKRKQFDKNKTLDTR